MTEKCNGNCPHFDKYNADKEKIKPITRKDGSVVEVGYCRTGNGLIFGSIEENSDCRHGENLPKIIIRQNITI
ncbi:MAG: hypothetical protein WCG91_04225 [Candidatus Shapirobacteria bacterium]